MPRVCWPISRVPNTGGGEGETIDAAASLATYVNVYSTMGWVTVGIGLLLVVLSPLVNKLCHGIR